MGSHSLGPERAGEQRLDRLIDGGEPGDHRMHGLRDRHVDAARRRHLDQRARGIDALGDGEPFAEHLLQALALAELDAERHVARLRAAAGEHQVAEARQARQRLAPRAERRAEAHHLGEAARDQRGMRAGAEFLAGDDAGGDGIDILHRAADLGARSRRRSNSSGTADG